VLISWLVIAAAYFVCLVHAGNVLLFHKPAYTDPPADAVAVADPTARHGLLLDVAMIYSSVLGAIALCSLIIYMHLSSRRSGWREFLALGIWRGLWWVLYVILAASLVSGFQTSFDLTPEQVRWAALVAILAVPLVYYLCPSAQPWPSGAREAAKTTPT
jgi:hypothetical protein